MIKLYDFILQLYPKEFRDDYGSQIIVTAEDRMNDVNSSSERFVAYMQVMDDLLSTIVTAHLTKGRDDMSTLSKTSLAGLVGQKLLTILQIYGIGVMSVLLAQYAYSAVGFFLKLPPIAFDLGYISTETWTIELITYLMPVILFMATAILFRNIPKISLLNKISYTYIIALIAIAIHTIITRLFIPLTGGGYEIARGIPVSVMAPTGLNLIIQCIILGMLLVGVWICRKYIKLRLTQKTKN